LSHALLTPLWLEQVPHYTDGFSLLLNASLLARFAAPLCFNFLYCLRMQHSVNTLATQLSHADAD